MPGSIDLNTNKGIVIVLLSAGLVGGGASVLQNQVFGPGGEWQKVVTNQAVIRNDVSTLKTSLTELSVVLKEGFEKVADASDSQKEGIHDIKAELKTFTYEIEALKKRMDALEAYRQDLLHRP
jgi:hypothetical protein